MTKTLIRNADPVVTMDARRCALARACVLVQDGAVTAIGPDLTAPPGAEIIDATGCIVTPGLVITHPHLYQTLTKAVPGGQDALLFGWLKTLSHPGALQAPTCGTPIASNSMTAKSPCLPAA